MVRAFFNLVCSPRASRSALAACRLSCLDVNYGRRGVSGLVCCGWGSLNRLKGNWAGKRRWEAHFEVEEGFF